MHKLIFILALCCVSFVLNAKNLYFYSVKCKECNQDITRIYHKEYCALSTVISGGLNSGCILRFDKHVDMWELIAEDPKDEFSGETQVCGAVCF